MSLLLSLAAPPRRNAQAVPGHHRWHSEIPAVAEVMTGGSVRIECQGRYDVGEGDSTPEPVLCGPIAVMGAEAGDVIAVDVLGIGRADGRYGGAAHPGVIGCAPAPDTMTPHGHGNGRRRDEGADSAPLLGHVRPGLASYERIAAQAVRTEDRLHDVATCAVAALIPGSRILLPVHAPGAKLSVGDLHFPWPGAERCGLAAMAGWIDLRVHLTKRGVERFRINSPLLMPDPAPEP